MELLAGLLRGGPLVMQALGVATALGMMRQAPFEPILLAQLALYGGISMLTAWMARGGLVLRAWHIAVSGVRGSPVSRSRAMFRSALAWSPSLAASALVFGSNPEARYEHAVTLVGVGCWLAGAAYAVYRPERGLQDRISGTWLVPR